MYLTPKQKNILISSRLAAGCLLLVSLLPLPGRVLLFFRILVTLIAVLNTLAVYKRNGGLVVVFICVAVLFNPFFPVSATAPVWTLLNLLFGILLVLAWWRRW